MTHTEEPGTPLQRLIAAAGDLIAAGMAQCQADDPQKSAEAIALDRAGARRRLTIDHGADGGTISFDLIGENDTLKVFRFDLRRVPRERH